MNHNERAVVWFIKNYHRRNGYPPVLSEVAKECQCSIPQAKHMIVSLEKQGIVTRSPHKARTLRVVRNDTV